MRPFLTPFLALALLILPVLQTGCASSPSAKQTLLTVAESVNDAMNIYGEKFRAGELTEEQITRVRKAHAAYRAAHSLASAAAGGDLKTIAPADVGALAFELITAINLL